MPEYIIPLEDLAGDLFVNRHKELRLGRLWIQNIPRRFNALAKQVGFFGLPE